MCGIGGIACLGQMPDLEERLLLIRAAMNHRGPDDRGVFTAGSNGGSVGLCVARLAVQDVSARGHQPMVSPRSGAAIAFNGELYNVRELRRELTGKRYTFQGSSDTEVVLAAYDEWEVDCLSRLRGMFGLAVWDSRHQHVLLARDRLGIKPLYYADRGEFILLASEVRAILASGLVDRRVSTAGLGSYLALGAIQEPLTIIEGIQEIPAGHFALWRRGRLTVSAYWSLADAFRDRSTGVDRAAAHEQIRAALHEAVRLHLVSDVPLGVFLSGGIDSSTMAGLAAAAGASPRTVAVVFPDQPQFSEQRFISAVSEKLSTEHTYVQVDDQGCLASLTSAVAAMDQPTVDGVNTYIVSEAAREAGLTVALSGLGGDELFAGYDSFRRVPALNRLRTGTPAPVGRPVGALLRSAGRSSDRFDKLGRWVQHAEGTDSAYELQRELFGLAMRRALMPQFFDDFPAPSPAPSDLDPVNQVSYLELSRYMRNVLLRDADVMSMAHSLEVRVPFLDHKVVELVAGLPGRYKIRGDSPKPLLVNAVRELLPPEVVHRRKMGFTFPFESWMRNGMRDAIETKLCDSDHGSAVTGVLSSSAIRQVWQRYIDGRGHWSRPWALFVLKSWAEQHLGA